MTQSKLSDAKVKKIEALFAKGMSERNIAAKVGCSRSTVWSYIQKALARNTRAGRRAK